MDKKIIFRVKGSIGSVTGGLGGVTGGATGGAAGGVQPTVAPLTIGGVVDKIIGIPASFSGVKDTIKGM